MKSVVRCFLTAILLSCAAWAQWSSDPSKNLALSDIPGADQVQPKVLPLPNDSWYVSWFNNNPNDPPPNGYDVYYQMLNPNGYEQFPHDGVQVAKLTLSSTEDYGLAIDASGNALLAFQDDRKDPDNPQITAAKMSPSGQPLWGASGISLTFDSGFHASPKITATSDGNIVVGWTTDSAVILQKLDPNGHPLWVGRTAFEYGVTIQEPGFNYSLADLHASDNGSVIVSWVRNKGFGSNNYLYANKISASGQLMWGAGHVKVFDGGSLQFGEFPYFTPDGSGGAVFSWYSSSPTLQVYAQHILSDGDRGLRAQRLGGVHQPVQREGLPVGLLQSFNPGDVPVLDGRGLQPGRERRLRTEVQRRGRTPVDRRRTGDRAAGFGLADLGRERADRLGRAGLLVRSAGLRLRNHPGGKA